MTLAVTTSYATENAKAARTPVYVATFNSRYATEVLIDKPVGYWRMGDVSGATAVDSSGNVLNGTYIGSPQLNVPSPLIGDTSTAAQYNGTNQYATVADNDLLDPGDTLSIDGWIYTGTIGASVRSIIDKGVGGYFLVEFAGLIIMGKNGGNNIANSGGGANLVANTWYHVAATKAGGTTRIYVNGVDVTAAGTPDTIVATASPLLLGAITGPGDFWTGRLKDIALYSAALSAARIKAHYDCRGRQFSTAPVCDSKSEILADAPVGWYRVSETGGATAADSSGNNRSGSYA